MSTLLKNLVLSFTACFVLVLVSGCGGGESAPATGVLDPGKKPSSAGQVDPKSGKPAETEAKPESEAKTEAQEAK